MATSKVDAHEAKTRGEIVLSLRQLAEMVESGITPDQYKEKLVEEIGQKRAEITERAAAALAAPMMAAVLAGLDPDHILRLLYLVMANEPIPDAVKEKLEKIF